MKQYSFNFYFPTQPGARQECTIRVEATNAGTGFSRAWRQLKRDPKYKGRKGLDNFRVGVACIKVADGQAEGETQA